MLKQAKAEYAKLPANVTRTGRTATLRLERDGIETVRSRALQRRHVGPEQDLPDDRLAGAILLSVLIVRKKPCNELCL